MKYNTVLCDMGNVLIDFDPEKIVAHYTDDPRSAEILAQAIFYDQDWLDLDLGLLSDQEAITKVCKKLPSSLHELARAIIMTWPIAIIQIEAMIPIIKAIKEKGLKLILASNASLKFYEYYRSIDALQYFDGFLISAEIHQAKPDRCFYETLLKRFSLDQSACFMIDDKAENIEGAARCGIDGVVFTKEIELLKTILKLKEII